MMFLTTKSTRGAQPAPRAITLVEMLISMAVTLVMMAAVVNLFANIGAGVRNRRASMELGGQLRSARARLFKDLAGATCAVRPKLPTDDHDDGYFELIEGEYSDKNPSALVSLQQIDAPDPNDSASPWGLQHQTSLVPRDNAGRLVQWDDNDGDGVCDDGTERATVRSSGSALGDYDDILALTVRSESEPFVGRMPVWNGATNRWVWQSIESDLAEVIWYAVENPANGSLGEPGMRTVYRRVLLIAPWVQDLPAYIGGATAPQTPIDLDRVYYQLSDISFRREGSIRVPNTLSDLTKREYRFAHFRNLFPHALDISAIRNNPNTNRNSFPEFLLNADGNPVRPVLHPFGLPFEWDEPSNGAAFTYTPTDVNSNSPTDEPGLNNPGDDRKGEDVMLNDVLAFDLRVYDPGAPLYQAGDFVLEPSDHGWETSYLNNEFDETPPVLDDMVGQGAFVDLGYVEARAIRSVPPNPATGLQPTRPHFAGVPDLKSQLNFTAAANPIKFIVYDTWPYHYEDDGLDQDGDWLDTNNNGVLDPGIDGNIDEGTDGIDDIEPYDLDNDPNTPREFPTTGVGGQRYALYGPDDPIERETYPPYDRPLRAVQAKIRVYDRDTRQIREATVTRNFVPQ